MTDNMDGAFTHHDHDLGDGHTDTTSWTHTGVDDAMAPLGAMESDSLGVIHGAPAAQTQEWFLQAGNGYCLPASLTQVVSEVTGVPLPDESIVDARLAELGTPAGPNGLPLAAGVPLLESFGIPAHMETGASLSVLESYLDQGRSIILGVNADEIWYGQNDPTDNPSGGANHAVVVTAIDTTHGLVVLSDPGSPDGNQETVPLSQFEEAWAAGDNQLLVVDSSTGFDHGTDTEPTDYAPEALVAPGPVLMPIIVTIPDVHHEIPQSGAGPYVVLAGDTLWDIAERVYGDGAQYMRIAEANGLSNPDFITPGEHLVIPQ